MAVVIRKMGRRRYAYLARRMGRRVVHVYLGRADDPAVRRRIQRLTARRGLPADLYPLFWDTDPRGIEPRRHARYVIERILELGDLEAAAWARRTYPGELILDVAETSRSVSERSRNFWTLWLGG